MRTWRSPISGCTTPSSSARTPTTAATRVRENAHRMLDYVAEGGTLVVQYQTYGYGIQGLRRIRSATTSPTTASPRPMPPWRCWIRTTRAMRSPNRLGPRTSTDWVHDRGLYFFGEWDHALQAAAGVDRAGGGAARGRPAGRALRPRQLRLRAYSFFRQIPAGVPGAIRLFANLLGLAEARLRTRTSSCCAAAGHGSLVGCRAEEAPRIRPLSTPSTPANTSPVRASRGDEMFILLEGTIEVVDRSGPRASRSSALIEPVESVGELACSRAHAPHGEPARQDRRHGARPRRR